MLIKYINIDCFSTIVEIIYGEASKVSPIQKGEAENVLAMLNGRGKQFWGGLLKVLAIAAWEGANNVHPWGGMMKSFTLSQRGGGHKVLYPRFAQFAAFTPPCD